MLDGLPSREIRFFDSLARRHARHSVSISIKEKMPWWTIWGNFAAVEERDADVLTYVLAMPTISPPGNQWN